MEKHYEEINLENKNEAEEAKKEEDTNLKDKLDEVTEENKRLATTIYSVVAVCSTIIAGTIVATVSLL
ncbi:hypothetical protein K8R61_02275 [bacterium]|nr:hypothetical protein [bacterium]